MCVASGVDPALAQTTTGHDPFRQSVGLEPIMSSRSDQSRRARTLTILIVEDDRFLRETLELLFQDEGFMVVTANNGSSGLVEAERSTPDLIVLDIEMPVMDGQAFAASYEQQMGGDGAAILCVSGKQGGRGMPAQCNGVLRKPFDIDDLVRRVWGLLA
jgi:DNA-binding response OmpR family regulator